jgi:hypothetical protein
MRTPDEKAIRHCCSILSRRKPDNRDVERRVKSIGRLGRYPYRTYEPEYAHKSQFGIRNSELWYKPTDRVGNRQAPILQEGAAQGPPARHAILANRQVAVPQLQQPELPKS